MNDYSVYCVSDHTGVTVEAVAKSVLAQFPRLECSLITLPFVDSTDKAQATAARIALSPRTLVFSSLTAPALRTPFREAGLALFDVFELIAPAVETALGEAATPSGGHTHGMAPDYEARMEAVNFTVKHDDGQETRGLNKADLVLVGVSRSSKTPLSMYLAHKGYKVANVPLVKGIEPPAELDRIDPKKVVGLVISPRRLVEIRTSRLVNMGQSMRNSYADYERVEEEISFCRQYFRRHPDWLMIDVTNKSIEESASEILRRLGAQQSY